MKEAQYEINQTLIDRAYIEGELGRFALFRNGSTYVFPKAETMVEIIDSEIINRGENKNKLNLIKLNVKTSRNKLERNLAALFSILKFEFIGGKEDLIKKVL